MVISRVHNRSNIGWNVDVGKFEGNRALILHLSIFFVRGTRTNGSILYIFKSVVEGHTQIVFKNPGQVFLQRNVGSEAEVGDSFAPPMKRSICFGNYRRMFRHNKGLCSFLCECLPQTLMYLSECERYDQIMSCFNI